MEFLDKIKSPADIKKLSIKELKVLAKEIRQVILDTVIANGGHLASSLGAVDIILAMHYCFDAPNDKFLFDVGHQAYAHKILTGRMESFSTLRQLNGIAGFPKRNESEYDVANTGHSSTSLSLACGISRGLKLDNNDGITISLIGDGALTGGLAYEALNDSISVEKKQIIILNDNSMSISANVGSTAKYLLRLHNSKLYNSFKKCVRNVANGFKINTNSRLANGLMKAKNSVKYFLQGGMPFEQFDLQYFGPINGNDLEELIYTFSVAKNNNKSLILHCVTQKGYGYKEAEENPAKYHGYSPNCCSETTFSDAFGSAMCTIGGLDDKVYAVTAAMREGTGLKDFSLLYPDRFSDVGICEAHATTMCAGLAIQGYKPYFAVYSSFLQRAYDSVIHDVCLQDLPVTFCVDRAGIVPQDGETHQGIYDTNFLNFLPNMAVLSPKTTAELEKAVIWSLNYNHPLTIRYPKGWVSLDLPPADIELGKWDIISGEADFKNNEIVLIAASAKMCEECYYAAKILEERGVKVTLVNATFITPLDDEFLKAAAGKIIFTVEDNILTCGFGSSVLSHINNNFIDTKVVNYGIQNDILTHATVKQLQERCSLDRESLASRIIKDYNEIKRLETLKKEELS